MFIRQSIELSSSATCLLNKLRSSVLDRETVLNSAELRVILSTDLYTNLAKLEELSLGVTCDANAFSRKRQRVSADRRYPEIREPDVSPLVSELISDWLEHHVANLAAPARYHVSVEHWRAFIRQELRLGSIEREPRVRDLSPDFQRRYRSWRSASGVGGHTISRDLAVLRGALSWAYKHQRIDRAPFIMDVPMHLRGAPRDRILSTAELTAILEACSGRPDRQHLVRFIVIELGTAGRPQAVLELEHTNIDLDRNLINPNHAGRLHLRKRRAIVPIAAAVRPWVEGIEGKLIKYRVPTSAKTQAAGGPHYFERETRSIKTSWNAACADAGVCGATPKTLRHTMLTWLASRGVPFEQRRMLAGHSAQGTTARNYEHLSPDYLKAAIAEVDAFFVELRKHTAVIVPPRSPECAPQSVRSPAI